MIGIVFLSVNACNTPSENFARVATDFKYHQHIIQTPLFQHQIFINEAAVDSKNQSNLHVYLDGDGTPWKNHRWLARDPTSRNTMILRLMQLDKAPSILLGRPCYHGLSNNRQCHPRYWTSHRYSKKLVDSLVMALKQWLVQEQYNQVTLIGYSGGGVLAVLIAREISQIKTVVTLAANLDVTEWSRYHGYIPLYDSLNPADLELHVTVRQLHIAGADDKIVPAYIIEKYARQQENAEYILVPEQNHRCCWTNDWVELLKRF